MFRDTGEPLVGGMAHVTHVTGTWGPCVTVSQSFLGSRPDAWILLTPCSSDRRPIASDRRPIVATAALIAGSWQG